LLAAITLLSATLVPALRILRDALEQSYEIENLEMINTLVVSKLDERLVLAADAWSPGTTTGDFSSLGYSSIRFQAVASDQPASGGLTDQLMAITVTVWDDENGNSTLDAGEPSSVLASKVAKLEAYPE
jgi:hypothetical protein